MVAGGIKIVDESSREEMLSLSRAAVKLEPGFAPAHASLALGLTETLIASLSSDIDKDKAEALQHSDMALGIAPSQVYVLMLCSTVNRVLGDAALAQQLAERIESITSKKAPFSLYPALIANGHAAKAADQAAESPGTTEPYAGIACVVAGRFGDAEKHFWQSLRVDSKDHLAWLNLANAFAYQNRLEEAENALQEAKSIVPTLSLAEYENRLRLEWRDDDEIVKPLVDGLKQLNIN